MPWREIYDAVERGTPPPDGTRASDYLLVMKALKVGEEYRADKERMRERMRAEIAERIMEWFRVSVGDTFIQELRHAGMPKAEAIAFVREWRERIAQAINSAQSVFIIRTPRMRAESAPNPPENA